MVGLQSGSTLAARITPPGVGGISVIEILGPDAWEVAMPFLRSRANQPLRRPQPDRPRLARWVDGAQSIDEVIVVCSDPRTTMPTVLICAHGSIRVVERILMCLSRSGAEVRDRLACAAAWHPLSWVEVLVMEHLPKAHTQRVAIALVDQIETLADALGRCGDQLRMGQSDRACEVLDTLIASYELGRRLLEGIHVVIVGAPGVGKSTLANRLFERPLSIEGDEAGTTRDWVEAIVAIDGVPVRLTDTAGVGPSSDPLQLEAMRRSSEVTRRADVQILLLDGSRPGAPPPPKDLLDPDRLIVGVNKCDLQDFSDRPVGVSEFPKCHPVVLSALQSIGLEELRERILETAGMDRLDWSQPFIWDRRQLEALRRARQAADVNPGLATGMLFRLVSERQEQWADGVG